MRAPGYPNIGENSKNPDGGALTFGQASWRSLVSLAKRIGTAR
ncbi:DUF397 domain-containing protein [Micromonospora taraxaci]